MATFPENATPAQIDSAKNKINEIYKKVQAGENFAELARKYSDDKRSAPNGGEMNWFGVGQMVSEFESAAFALKNNGDISAPVKTTFGWHIIKRIDHRPISSFNEIKDFIKQKLQRDDRAKVGQLALIAKVKKEVGFKENPDKTFGLIPYLDSSVFKGNWNRSKFKDIGNNVLFTLGNKQCTMTDFADFVGKTQTARKAISYKTLLNQFYKEYVNNKIVEFESDRLDQKYPEFRYLIQEYHDGILLFNLMEDKIWTKAARDSVGLEKFYQDHKEQYNWGDRVRALVVTSPKKPDIDEAYKMAEDYNSGKIKANDILNKVCKNDSTKKCISVTDTLFEKGDNLILDSIGWTAGISKIIIKDSKFGFFVKKEMVPPTQKSLQDVKGMCIADYQAYLEKIYLEELHKKYKIVVNEKLLNSL
jgi:peptidyl-prolyl cis-trans isomerase SurA